MAACVQVCLLCVTFVLLLVMLQVCVDVSLCRLCVFVFVLQLP